jgi:hypothetical protein
MISNAADQLKQAWAIGVGIWSLGQWAYAQTKRRDITARMLMREDTVMKNLADFVSAHKSGNRVALETALRDAEKAVTIYKANSEKVHMDRWELTLLAIGKTSADKMAQVRAILESE